MSGRPAARPAARDALPRARTRRTRSTECTTLAYLTTWLALLVCSWPMKCQRTGADAASATAAALGAASWSRFSPKSAWPSSASATTSSAGLVLVTAMSVISLASRPAAAHAAATRAWIAARLPASSARRAGVT